MSASAAWVLPVLVAAGSWMLTGVVRRYAHSQRLMDVPTARSSHSIPTPRGGGAAIAIATAIAFGWLATAEAGSLPWGVLAGSLVVAAVGWIDDHRHLSAGVRLSAHFAAAALAVVSLGGTQPLAALGVNISGGALGDILAIVFIVWMLNLTNFMDGIDGLAGVQVATVCAAGAGLYGLADPGSGLWREPLLLAAGALGFLIWNWPPARIFMGDVGSGYVGFLVAAFMLRWPAHAPELFAAWLILYAVFVADSTVTLLRRTGRLERIFSAHRSHAYQHLAVAWKSHKSVTLAVLAINVGYLAPLAFAVVAGRLEPAWGLTAAYVPLLALVWWIGAGRLNPAVRLSHGRFGG